MLVQRALDEPRWSVGARQVDRHRGDAVDTGQAVGGAGAGYEGSGRVLQLTASSTASPRPTAEASANEGRPLATLPGMPGVWKRAQRTQQ